MRLWRRIKGYSGIYKVSNDGLVKSIDHFVNSKNGFKRIQYGRILKQSKSRKGYMMVSLVNDKKKFHASAHRLVALAFIPNPLNLPQVNHKDGDKSNNHVDNLEWVTGSENVKHAFKNRLIVPNYAENHHMSKLKNFDILAIRDRYKNGENATSIYKDYQVVSFTAFQNIISGKTYKDINL